MVNALKNITKHVGGLFLDTKAKQATRPILGIVGKNGMQELDPRHQAWLKAVDFKPKRGNWVLLPGADGVEAVAFALDDKSTANPLLPGALPPVLPAGDYHFGWTPERPDVAALAWALGSYAFRRYKPAANKSAKRLRLPQGVSRDDIIPTAAALWLARDLINTPANDMGPEELAAAALGVADSFDADCEIIVGDELLGANFPLIHAVGRASPRAPRLIDMTWGDAHAPKITLVGKGICFDSGGLNIKPGNSMGLMKKDMGGAAAALALAIMIMSAKLPVRLRVIIAAAENSVSGTAYRPGDILPSRAGLTVEIGNTDAEGRLVLADALALADADKPDTLITFATLTGAARVALGPDLPAAFSTDDAFIRAVMDAGRAVGDPVWQMPFWEPYDTLIDGKISDLNNAPSDGMGGAITAALFLKRFVKQAKRYTHFDMFGWVSRAQAARPAGGDAQSVRAIFEYLKGQFGKP